MGGEDLQLEKIRDENCNIIVTIIITRHGITWQDRSVTSGGMTAVFGIVGTLSMLTNRIKRYHLSFTFYRPRFAYPYASNHLNKDTMSTEPQLHQGESRYIDNCRQGAPTRPGSSRGQELCRVRRWRRWAVTDDSRRHCLPSM